MRIGVLGTGTVGRTLATALAERGHDVVLGSRDPAAAGAGAASHADAARHGDLVVLALPGTAVLDVVAGLGDACDGKVVVDVTNPLDFSQGFPPALFTGPRESLGEQVQAALPQARVVKALNTVNADVMVDPAVIPGAHSLLVAGDDDAAKQQVRGLLSELGWPDDAVVDLGGIPGARATEAYLLLWVALYAATGTPYVSVQVVRGESP